MKLIFIHGPAASGKHTMGTLLSEKINIPLFHNHLVVDTAKSLFGFGDPGFIEIRDKMWRVCFHEAAKARKSFIFTFNPERTVPKTLIDSLVDDYKIHGGKVYFVELACSDKAILKIIDNDSRKRFGKLTDGAIYKSFKAEGGFDFPELPTPIAKGNTEKNSPEQSADLIVKALIEQVGGANV